MHCGGRDRESAGYKELEVWDLKTSSIKRTIGYGSLILSMVLYLIIFAVPFLDLDADLKVGVASSLYIGSYALTFLGAALLGREIMEKLKTGWKKYFRKARDSDSPGNP